MVEAGGSVHVGGVGEPAVAATDDEVVPELSVVVPAYNEEDRVGEAVERIATIVGGLFERAEVIVVDDGSDDGTGRELDAIDAARPNVEVHTLADNRGKGHAIKTGCARASGERVLFIDGDGEIAPGQVAAFLARMSETDADVVIGSKRHPESTVDYPWTRRVLSRGYSLLVRALFDLRVTDTQVGMKLLRREVVEAVLPLVTVRRYAFDVELLTLAVDRGFDVAEAPVTLELKLGSHVDPRAVARIAWDTARVFYRLRLRGDDDRVDAPEDRRRGNHSQS